MLISQGADGAQGIGDEHELGGAGIRRHRLGRQAAGQTRRAAGRATGGEAASRALLGLRGWAENQPSIPVSPRREAAQAMVQRSAKRVVTGAADKSYGMAEFVQAMREQGVTPQIVENMRMIKICLYRLAGTWLAVALLMLFSVASEAAIVTDGTVGPARNLPGPHFQVGADLGAIRGVNLFHSFSTFSINTGESATFTGPASIANLISRVTGGEVSNIDGLLRSEVGTANFYFINPAGVMFGPNARIDVPAAFHVGTADELRFSDGYVFSAAHPDASRLSVAQPESFGFLSPQPASLTVNGSRLEFAPGSRVSMIAGDVAVQNAARLSSKGGEIHITAVGDSKGAINLASGSAEARPTGAIAISGSSTLDVSGAQGGETVALRGRSVEIANSIIAGDHYGADRALGQILLEADNVRVVNSDVHAQVFGAGRGNDIVVIAKDFEVDATTAPDGRSRLTTRVMPQARGAAGDVRVEADRVSLTNGGQLSSIVEAGGLGPGGTVDVRATNTVSIEGSNSAGSFSGIVTTTRSEANAAGGMIAINAPTASVRIIRGGFLQSGTAGAGRAGDIRIAAHDLEISTEGAAINSRTSGSGNAGAIRIDAAGAVTVTDSALFADTEGAGDAGSITIAADTIALQQGKLDVSTSNIGEAGAIRIEARDSVVLANNSDIKAFSGAQSTDSRLGNAGNVSINTGSLSIADSSIDVFSFSRANAGSIKVIADEVHVDNTKDGTITAFNASNFGGSSLAPGSELIAAEEGRSGTILLDASKITFDHGANISITTDAGDGGAVIIRADELSLLNGASILGITAGPGRGGDVRIDVTGTFLIEGGRPQNGITSTGGITTSPVVLEVPRTGPAGAISIAAGTLIVGQHGEILSDSFSNASAGAITLDVGTLEVRDGGQISSSAGREGPGANIVITAQGAVRVHGVDPELPSQSSKISADAAFSGAGGRGGSILIATPLLVLEQGGILSSETLGGGAGGAINVKVDELIIQSGGEISTSTSGAARAGTIQIDANSVFINQEGSESLNPLANAQGTGLFSKANVATGDAGEISVNARTTLKLLNGAQISTSTSSAGNAGTITITAGELVIEGGVPGRQVSAITSSADAGATGTVGTVQVTADSLIISEGEISITANQTLPKNRLGSGPAGRIRVDAGEIRLDGGARITAASSGNVPASAIDIRANDMLHMAGGSAITTSSKQANGGPISIDGRLLVVEDSLITTSVEGAAGNGGNITLAPKFLVLNGGFIQANTAAPGARGGDILVDTQALIASGGEVQVGSAERQTFQRGSGLNLIQAAAPGGEQGTIAITAPDLDISGALANLSTTFIELARLSSDPCAAITGQAASSLVQGGRGGIPPGPEEPTAVSFGGDRLDRLLSAPVAPVRKGNRSNVAPDGAGPRTASGRADRCQGQALR